MDRVRLLTKCVRGAAGRRWFRGYRRADEKLLIQEQSTGELLTPFSYYPTYYPTL